MTNMYISLRNVVAKPEIFLKSRVAILLSATLVQNLGCCATPATPNSPPMLPELIVSVAQTWKKSRNNN